MLQFGYKMKNIVCAILALFGAVTAMASWRSNFPEGVWQQKPRVIVLTDAETDDRCSMVHFLLYTNDMQVDAIIQTNSCFQKRGWSHDPWLKKQLDAYEKVYPNLKVHDAAYPTPDYLRQRVYVGDEDPSHVVLSGKQCKMTLPGVEPLVNPAGWPDTPGSNRIVEVLLEQDPRPVFIQCWGGTNTAAKAFQKLKATHPDDYERAVSKAVLYCIWYQDAGGSYIEREHPLVTILLNHHFSGSWDYGTMTNTTDFVNRYMRNKKNPLGLLYTQPYISEGDTPAFLYSIANGLRSHEDPTYGGWGGCFYPAASLSSVGGATSAAPARVYRDTGFGQLREWIEPAMHDFQARLQWCVSPKYDQANHKPKIEVQQPLDLTVHSGDTVRLSAIVSDPDPIDIDALWKTRGEMWAQKGITRKQVEDNPEKYNTPWRVAWYQYPSGTYKDNIDLMYFNETDPQTWFVAPEVNEPKTIHVILEAFDMTTPRLTSYARYIVTVKPRKPRVIVSSDIGGTDPDDNQSVAHLLMYSNEFDIEGLISSPSFGDGHKGEILRMIDVYEKDLPRLSRHIDGLMKPEALRPLVKQGRMSEAPPCGYDEPTEGSQWIVQQARRPDDRPLYVLVWGCLEDVAQALHDAPDIAPRLRVHWIGGPNKKWGVNAYCYIVEHFPNLWMIENNTTYRGFIYDSKNNDEWNAGFFEHHIKDAGHLGRDFAAYYKGNPKLGDTPSLLYLMNDCASRFCLRDLHGDCASRFCLRDLHGGNPDNPEQPSWAGHFVKTNRTPRTVLQYSLVKGQWQKAAAAPQPSSLKSDTAQICSIIEWQLKGPVRTDIAPDSACITLDIRKQQWKGYYKGNGLYVLRHSTYYTGTLPYTITSTVKGFKPLTGELIIQNTWNVPQKDTDLKVGPYWWTDSYAPDDFWHNCAGANTQRTIREEIMRDWASRWAWLKE